MASFLDRFFVSAYPVVSRVLPRPRSPQLGSNEATQRILCLTRAGVGDMIQTLPLLHALRRHFPKAHLTVACDLIGEPIALACRAVNDVITLAPAWNPWQAAFNNAPALQGYDWVIVAEKGFDRQFALLAGVTKAAVRIGFERRLDRPSLYFTDPVALPQSTEVEHQIETILRLLRPLGIVNPTAYTVDLTLVLPDSAKQFATERLAQSPFAPNKPFMLLNLSSAGRPRFREEDFISLSKRIISMTDLVIGLVAAPMDQQQAREIALCMASPRIVAVDTAGPLEVAALLEHAVLVVTPHGGTAHLAAVTDTPAVILWSEGSYEKGHSRNLKHIFVRLEKRESTIPVDRVWTALQPLFKTKPTGAKKTGGTLEELPPTL
jgi:ADP-heptose:LPS heptosyltransferase